MFCPVDGTKLDSTDSRSADGDRIYKCPKCLEYWLRRLDAHGGIHIDEVREDDGLHEKGDMRGALI